MSEIALDEKTPLETETPEHSGETPFSYQEKLHQLKDQVKKTYAAFDSAVERIGVNLAKLFQKEQTNPAEDASSEAAPATEAIGQVEEIQESAQTLTTSTLEKVSGQLGTNEGGWYEDQVTQQKFYTKFYKNPDQAKVEYIANAIYEQLGIRAVHSQLLEMGGKLAVASEEVAGAQATYRDEQQLSEDVQNGFIADAYLGNWDVVGLNYDNIVKGADGNLYRIDNGGAMTFRAQGGEKAFPADSIPELENMRKAEFPAGQVFEGLTEQDLRSQAQQLVEKLSEHFIDEVVAKAGLDGPVAEAITASLKGRRQVLMEKFSIAQPKEKPRRAVRLPKAFDRLREIRNRIELERDPFPRVEIVADRDAIEGQQVNVIDNIIGNRYDVIFKLTESQDQAIIEKLKERAQREEIPEGEFQYEGRINSYSGGRAWQLEHNGIKIEISQNEEDSRAFYGQVRLEIPKQDGEPINPEKLNEEVEQICSEVLGIENALAEPDEEAFLDYSAARYKWHHALNEIDPEAFIEVQEDLVRSEVFPEYSTIVELGKHKKYEEKYGPYFFFHKLDDEDTLPRIIKSGGLMASHERFRRGMIIHGMSSSSDMRTGGGDSVFVRHVSARGAKRDEEIGNHYSPFGSQTRIIFKNRIADRTDWYAYSSDQYGSTKEDKFTSRISPDKLFDLKESVGNYDSHNNEEMFRTGIAVEDFACIATYKASDRTETLEKLRAEGITTVNGKPIEDFVQVVNDIETAFQIARENDVPATGTGS